MLFIARGVRELSLVGVVAKAVDFPYCKCRVSSTGGADFQEGSLYVQGVVFCGERRFRRSIRDTVIVWF